MTSSAAQSLVEVHKAAETTRVFLTRVTDAVFGVRSLRMLTMSQSTGISYLQESIIGNSGQAKEMSPQGDTSHHAAVDEAHPEMISEFLRDQHGSMAKGDGK